MALGRGHSADPWSGHFLTSVREQKGKASDPPPVEKPKKKSFLSFEFGKKKKDDDSDAKKKKKGIRSPSEASRRRIHALHPPVVHSPDAGLPLLRSLQILEQQQKGGKLKDVLGLVVEDVESGTLSEAMAKNPKAFDRLYSKMVNAGEIMACSTSSSSVWPTSWRRPSDSSAHHGAMIYPIVVILIAIVIVSGIMIFVIPKFEEIFNDFNTEPPSQPSSSSMPVADGWQGPGHTRVRLPRGGRRSCSSSS